MIEIACLLGSLFGTWLGLQIPTRGLPQTIFNHCTRGIRVKPYDENKPKQRELRLVRIYEDDA